MPYGEKSNLSYLFFYGFTLPNAPQPIDYYWYIRGHKVSITMPVDLTKSIYAYRLNNSKVMVSLKDEIESLKALLKTLRFYYSSYDSKLEEDKAKLKTTKVQKDFNLTNIYRILIEEKEMILENKRQIKNFIKILTADSISTIKTKLNELSSKNSKNPSEYVNNLINFFSKV